MTFRKIAAEGCFWLGMAAVVGAIGITPAQYLILPSIAAGCFIAYAWATSD